jgi:hypothetical protein
LDHGHLLRQWNDITGSRRINKQSGKLFGQLAIIFSITNLSPECRPLNPEESRGVRVLRVGGVPQRFRLVT